MHMYHIKWRLDGLVFNFGKINGNQTVRKYEDPWNIYVYPKKNYLCQLSELANYIVPNRDILKMNPNILRVLIDTTIS